MPFKSPEERVRQAKRHGTPVTVRSSDVAKEPAKSRHHAKKSSEIAGIERPARRRASPKAPPGEGRNRTRVFARPAAAAKQATAPVKRPKRSAIAPEKGPHKGVNVARGLGMVEGRKKSPSRMRIKGKGGPFKKTRLHGG